jgi:hypothetical protein
MVTATSTTFSIESSTAAFERVQVGIVGYAGLSIRSSSVTLVDFEMREKPSRALDCEGSAVRVTRGDLNGVMACQDSSVAMSDVRSLGSTLRVLSGCSANVQRAAWNGHFVVRPDSRGATLRLEDVAIDAQGTVNALSLDSDTLTELNRVSLVGAPQAIDARDGAELRGTDVDLDDSGGGIGLTFVGARVNLSRLRVYARGDRQGLGALAANESEVRGSDWTIDGLRDQGLSFNTGSPVELSRVKIANIAQVGLRLDAAALAPSSSAVEILGCGVGIELASTPWTEALASINLRRNKVPLSVGSGARVGAPHASAAPICRGLALARRMLLRASMTSIQGQHPHRAHRQPPNPPEPKAETPADAKLRGELSAAGVKADGSSLSDAVKAFQRDHNAKLGDKGVALKVDGIAGPKTRAALDARLRPAATAAPGAAAAAAAAAAPVTKESQDAARQRMAADPTAQQLATRANQAPGDRRQGDRPRRGEEGRRRRTTPCDLGQRLSEGLQAGDPRAPGLPVRPRL